MKNRIIKFRAWDKINKKFIDDIDMAINQMGLLFIRYEGRTDFHSISLTKSESFEIQQFTGLKDKNGKEIFEGDIVNEKNQEGENAIIKFEDGSFMFLAGNENSPCQEWYIKNNQIEIIGNIFEDKKLLNK